MAQMTSRLLDVLRAPLWALQLLTGAKSFRDNPLIGSRRLNRLGLHAARVRASAWLMRRRRDQLARQVPAGWREAFERDGFVVIDDFLPDAEFARLARGVLGYCGPARESVQGNAVTRRMAVDPKMMAAVPEMRRLLADRGRRALLRYVAGFRVEPVHYVQCIVTHCGEGDDPQEALHADAFHASLKAWFFLRDLGEDEAPFLYVPGSHRLTPERLAWERARSLAAANAPDWMSARGSPRIEPDELAALGLPAARAIASRANRLVVADTFGFHARGSSVRPVERVEIWSYARRNPFLPWLGGDLLSLPGLAERRVPWLWSLQDRFPRLLGRAFHTVGVGRPMRKEP
jgi:hypothetical protein